MGKNIIIFSADTLRQDRLGVYGYKRIKTPNIDNLAKDSSIFTNAFSTGPWTGPGFGSMLTSLYPHELGYVRPISEDQFLNSIAGKGKTVTEVLREIGYRTACFQGNMGVCPPELGYGAGFDIYDYAWKKRSKFHFIKTASEALRLRKSQSELLLSKAKSFIKRNQSENLFIWINLIAPHTPYIPWKYLSLAQFLAKDAPRLLRKDVSLVDPEKNRDKKLSEEDKEYIKEKYDKEVRIIDDSVGTILETLKKFEILDDSLFIFNSDHGEEFWDHGNQRSDPTFYKRGVDHGHTMYNELIKIPLIIHGEGFPRHKIPFTTSILDIAPTLLEWSGMEIHKTFKGIPAQQIIEGRHKERALLAEGICYGTEKKALIKGRFKAICHPAEKVWEVYDLKKDPLEKQPLEEENEETLQIRQELAHWIENKKQAAQPQQKLAQDNEKRIKERLQDLGYLN